MESAAMQGPGESHVLIVAVADIRGFTRLQACVHDHALHAEYHGKEAMKATLDAYNAYMARTKNIAEECLLRDVLPTVKKYALKSTGDGFMLAVSVGEAEDLQDPKEEDLIRREEITRTIINNMLNLVDQSNPAPNRVPQTIGEHTHAFINSYGYKLGAKLEEGTYLHRIAGAVCMGVGTLVRFDRYIQRQTGELHDDASGHIVNLAFRLCDRAGRRKGRDGYDSPLVLLDRRIGRIVEKGADMYTAGWKIVPWLLHEPLRGIEENWCFAAENSK